MACNIKMQSDFENKLEFMIYLLHSCHELRIWWIRLLHRCVGVPLDKQHPDKDMDK